MHHRHAPRSRLREQSGKDPMRQDVKRAFLISRGTFHPHAHANSSPLGTGRPPTQPKPLDTCPLQRGKLTKPRCRRLSSTARPIGSTSSVICGSHRLGPEPFEHRGHGGRRGFQTPDPRPDASALVFLGSPSVKKAWAQSISQKAIPGRTRCLSRGVAEPRRDPQMTENGGR